MTAKWHFKSARAFSEHKDIWNQLSLDILGCEHPLAHADYVEPVIHHFSPEDLLLALKGPSGENGMVLLKSKQPGVWESFFPKTGPFTFAFIKNTDEGSADRPIHSLLQALPGYACLFAFYKLDSGYLTVKTNESDRYLEKIKFIETIRIPINKPFDEYWQERSKNLKRNITKKKNLIARNNIDWSFRELSDPDDMEEGVRVYGALESKGWKGEMGTAVNIDNHRGRFYVDMLSRFAKRNKATIYQLLFSDRVVASALTIRGGGMAVILKIAYDEGVKEYSPGMLMYYELHKKLFDCPEIQSIEYYGKATDRMKQWAVDIRDIYHLNYYRSSFVKKIICGLRKIRELRN